MPSTTSAQERRALIAAVRPGLAVAGLLTAAIALTPLVAALYLAMMVDVVLASRSGASLAGLFALAALVLGALGWLQMLRDRIFAQLGDLVALRLHRRVDAAVARSIESVRDPADGLQAARDLDAVRHFLGGRGVATVADLPAAILLLAAGLVLHGFIALALFAAVAIAAALGFAALRRAAAAARARTVALADRNLATEMGYRHAALLRVLGMHRRAAGIRVIAEQRLIAADARLAQARAGWVGVARLVRLVGWTAVIAVAAWLAATDRASAGVLVAAALLADRALQPFEALAAHARDIALARLGWTRLHAILDQVPEIEPPLPLPAPVRDLSVESISLLAPHSRRVVLRDIGFSLKAGEMLSVVGPSGAGKSALLQALAAAWAPAAGKVRLDGGALDQWDPAELGRHIGYLPQAPELFDGTVEQNIARFDPGASSDAVIAAAMAAGVHNVIVHLPQGYATEVGPGGSYLPFGQRQRIALARALFGSPFLLLLDDAAAFADAGGQAALTEALKGAKARGAVIVATGPAHATLDPSDYLLILHEGQRQDFGPRDDVRGRLSKRRATRTPKTIAAAAAVPMAQE